MSTVIPLQLTDMNEERGEAIQRRRLGLGIASVNAWSKDINMDRETLRRAEYGQASERTYLRIEKWLDDMEEELGAAEVDRHVATNSPAAPTEDVVEFRVGGNFGVDVVIRGPVDNLGELEQAVGRLLDRLREGETPRADVG